MQLHTDHKNLNICTIIHILRLHCVHLVNVTLTSFPRSRRLRRPTPCLLSKRLRGHTVFEQNSISIVPLLFKLVFAGVGMRGQDWPNKKRVRKSRETVPFKSKVNRWACYMLRLPRLQNHKKNVPINLNSVSKKPQPWDCVKIDQPTGGGGGPTCFIRCIGGHRYP